jgi:DNA helicase-2/ATP-dependent DNA helicase PcrA
LILQRYTPPVVLVNDTGDIFYINGRTGKYLEPAAGKANWNVLAMAREGLRYELASAFQKVEEMLAQENLGAFAHMITRALELLQNDEPLRAAEQGRTRFLLLDEFQDVNLAQIELAQLLAGTEQNLFAVGDPDQAIYGFRGTDTRFFRQFQSDYPTARVIALTRNYRSTRTIVDAALQAIAPTTLVRDRALRAQTVDASRVTLRECATEGAEAEFVVATIERLVGGTSLTSFDTGRASGAAPPTWAFNDFAVLYRTDAQTPPLVEAFVRSGIPFQKRTHAPLGEHPTVQALLARLKSRPPGAPLADHLAAAAAELAQAGTPDTDLRPITSGTELRSGSRSPTYPRRTNVPLIVSVGR